ncbi:hypothetical protein IM40_02965 [Candidatus Paracaedimonas acanthamoebae]|nr:hypothetical protein IM40_02965 [Candidatus Paracaedimonas acanthamoebae]
MSSSSSFRTQDFLFFLKDQGLVPLHLNPPPLLLKLFSIRLKPCENFCYFFLSLFIFFFSLMAPIYAFRWPEILGTSPRMTLWVVGLKLISFNLLFPNNS